MFIFVNDPQMPSYLSKSIFDDWFKKFNQALVKIGLSEWDYSNTDIEIEFSNEEKTETHGIVSLEDVKEKIRKKWKINKRTAEILSQINNIDDYFNKQMSSPLAETIHVNNQNDSYEKIREMLDRLFGEIYFNEYVLGEYYHTKKRIVLYTKNIEHVAIPSRTTDQNFEATFIHELFHAYHYRNNDREIRFRRDYTSTVIKESFAAAFEWNYCVEYKIAGDRDLWWKWQKHSVLAYPYSGAQYLIDETSYQLQTTDFCVIFKMSLTDMDQSLRILTLIEFYDIKNLIQYREKEVEVTDLRAAFNTIMKKDKISTIAQREIPFILKQTNNRHLIGELLDLKYSYDNFHMTQYPVLATTPMYDKSGHLKSYSEPILCINKTNYYMTAQWHEKHIDLLLDWIWTHR